MNSAVQNRAVQNMTSPDPIPTETLSANTVSAKTVSAKTVTASTAHAQISAAHAQPDFQDDLTRQIAATSSGRLDQEPWSRLFETSLQHCHRGEWELGVLGLTQLLSGVRKSELPGYFYSYLGYGAARCNGHIEQGIKLCRRAVRLEFYQPENYVNLARTYLLNKDRRGAWDAIARGLAIDPDHDELKKLEQELGRRQPSTIPFLSRANILNRIFGRLRHDFRPQKHSPQKQENSTGHSTSDSSS